MSTDTVKCPQCGSTDATEFKPSRYVCAHCEAVFRRVPLQALHERCHCGSNATGACVVCQQPACDRHLFSEADETLRCESCATKCGWCENRALGYCRTCTRPYCPTHGFALSEHTDHYTGMTYLSQGECQVCTTQSEASLQATLQAIVAEAHSPPLREQAFVAAMAERGNPGAIRLRAVYHERLIESTATELLAWRIGTRRVSTDDSLVYIATDGSYYEQLSPAFRRQLSVFRRRKYRDCVIKCAETSDRMLSSGSLQSLASKHGIALPTGER